MALVEELENNNANIGFEELLEIEISAYERAMAEYNKFLAMLLGKIKITSDREIDMLLDKTHTYFRDYLRVITRVFKKIDSNWALSKRSCEASSKIVREISSNSKLREMLQRYNRLFNTKRKIEELFFNNIGDGYISLADSKKNYSYN